MATDPAPWGKLNAGQKFHVLAADVDRALSFAMLTGYEVALMEQIRERCWGEPTRAKGKGEPWPDARTCRLNLTHLESETGIPRQRFSRAKSNLINSRILVERGEDISINKAAHEWIFPATGEPRLSARLIEFCDQARPKRQAQLALSPEQENSEHFLVRTEQKSVHPTEQKSVRLVNTKVFGDCTKKCSVTEQKSVHPPGVPPAPPIGERTRGIRFSEDLERGGEDGQPPRKSLSPQEQALQTRHERQTRELQAALRLDQTKGGGQ
ncbi:hypothetical protein P12x_003022 [Tundrisphaera lichenicola]|uniref:hypothetical protein n=1 Tax=Tundrisphaera lichenicola TaxID=2029860 RepID=UPI003EB77B9E